MANLLDRASVVLTPTAYNNGEALCIKPDDASGDFTFSRNSAATRVNAKGLVKNVQILSSNLVQNGDFSEEGSEEVSNGDFSNGSTDWSLGTGWSIGEDKAVYTGTSNSDLAQNSILTSGKTYKLQYEIISSTLVNGIVKISGTTATAQNTLSQTIGTHTEYFIANGTAPTNFNIRIVSNTSGQYEITNISVKEVGQNWDLGTGWGVSNSQLTHDGSTTAATALQNIGLNGSAGTIYKLTLNVVSATNADLRFYSPNVGYISQIVNTGDALTYLLESNGSYQYLTGRNLSLGAALILDNISVIEITDDTSLPRINYEGFSYDGSGNVVPDSGCGHYLFEPQSTNLFNYSEDLSNSYWSDFGTEVSRNLNASQINPSGTAGSYELEGVGGLRRFGIFLTVTPSTDYTLSFYAKNIDATLLKALFTNSSITTYTYTSEVNTTDWSRVEINFTTLTGTSTSVQILRDLPIGESAYFWGLMLEQQSYATSYIPTEGSTVTRNQDVCTNGGSLATINSTEGVLYAEIAALGLGASASLGLNDGSGANRVLILLQSNGDIRGFVASNNTIVFDEIYSGISTLNNNKIAVSYKLNQFSLWINGIKRFTDTIGNTPIGLNQLDFDNGSGASNFFGKTKALAVFPYLTDSELQSLTTI